MIREAKPKDAPGIYKLAIELHAKSRYRDIPVCEEKAKFIVSRVVGSPTQFAWVSERDGELCGMLLGAIDEIMWSKKKEAHDLCFYVNEKGKGDGARLAIAFVKWAKSRNVALYGLSHSSGLGDTERTDEFYSKMGLMKHGSIFAEIRL